MTDILKRLFSRRLTVIASLMAVAIINMLKMI